MPVFEATRRVSVPADVAFAVAADVGAYREFLPLMERSTIVGPKRQTAHGQSFDAELAVAYPKLGLSGAFVSAVMTDATTRTVKAASKDGPFRHAETVWSVTPAAGGSDVAIRIDYAFRNPLLQLAAAGLMPQAVNKIMSAFESRALAVLARQQSLQQS